MKNCRSMYETWGSTTSADEKKPLYVLRRPCITLGNRYTIWRLLGGAN